MDAKLAKSYYSPGGYWKGFAAIKKLSEAANAPEETAKKWLFKQALWQIFLPAPKRIPWPKFDVPTPNKVHQADLLFLPHDLAGAKFSNTHSPLSTWPVDTKKLNP